MKNKGDAMTVKELQEIIDTELLIDDESILEQYSGDMSFVPRIRPKCVINVKKAEQLSKLVKWANETKTPIVSVSSGAPHFHGDTVPAVGGAVIANLSSLNKIVRIDTPNRIAMIETGVTFSELLPQLEKAGLRMNMPLLPRSNKSVATSILDREPGLMPQYQWDIQDPLTCVEVIFGSGDIFRTGSAGGPGTLEEQWNARQAQVNPMGPGQTSFSNALQGAQGTLGIITWATMRCELLPKLQKPFLVGSDNCDALLDFVYRILWWKAGEELFILDNNNLATILAGTPEEFESIRKSLPRWILFFTLAGFDYYPEEKISYQEKTMSEEAEKAGLDISDAIPGVTADKLLKLIQKPSEEPFWKIRRKGACQDIFFLTTLDKVPKFITVMQEQASRYGCTASDIGTYIQPMVQGTSCHCEFDIYYNPGNKAEAANVREIYSRAGEALIRAGAFFSRPYGAIVDEVYRRDAEITAALRKVKKIFDPNNVLNPGKLCF